MSRWSHYLDRASGLIEGYRGDSPLALALKEYFRGQRQMGATDRRYVSDLVYGYYRLGHAGRHLGLQERILLAYLLTRREASPLLEALRPEWGALVGLGAQEKVEALGGAISRMGATSSAADPGRAVLSLADIFPWQDRLSEGLDGQALAFSHLRQPDLFIRVRPGWGDRVREALVRGGVPFEEAGPATGDARHLPTGDALRPPAGDALHLPTGDALRPPANDALRLPTGASLQKILPTDKAYVVQDLGSQHMAALMASALRALGPEPPQVWDCCAASGGKSLLLKDLRPEARLTVSDVRPSILRNLDKRFEAAGVRYERAFAADLTHPRKDLGRYDLVLADLPCSGSGTWARTPEQLYFFREEQVDAYARLQRSILDQVARTVRSGGYLLLMTCSVFAEENEGNVAFLMKEGLQPGSREIFKGYERGADTLFGALLQRPA